MNKMKRTFALVAAAAGITLAAGSAQAVSSIDFVWNSTATTTVTSPAASTFITGSIVLTGDGNTAVPGPWLIVFTMNFDTVELDFAGAKENITTPISFNAMGNPIAGTGLTPITAGVAVDEANGIITQLDWSGNFTAPSGCQICVVTLGTVKFHVTAAANPAADRDITMGLFTPGLDGTFTQAGNAVAVNFGDAAVTGPVVPEPTTALLVVGGLLGLGYAGRRSAR